MNDKPIVGIYRIVNIVTGECYVGQSKDIERRWQQHEEMLFHGNHHSKKFQQAFNTYGPNVFVKVVLKYYHNYDKDLLDRDEKMFVQMFNSYHRGYNMTLGG